jgi:hypothetical protein
MVRAAGLICIHVVPREPLSVGVAHPALYIYQQSVSMAATCGKLLEIDPPRGLGGFELESHRYTRRFLAVNSEIAT